MALLDVDDLTIPVNEIYSFRRRGDLLSPAARTVTEMVRDLLAVAEDEAKIIRSR